MANNSPTISLTNIDPSDFISPDTINANFNILANALSVDYIVEAGKSGEWWYRKWNSGRMECGIDSKEFGKSEVHAWGSANTGLYATKAYNFSAYPIAFASRPYSSIQFQHDKVRAVRGSFIIQFNNDTPTTKPASFEVIDSWNAPIQPFCSIYACGTWK